MGRRSRVVAFVVGVGAGVVGTLLVMYGAKMWGRFVNWRLLKATDIPITLKVPDGMRLEDGFTYRVRMVQPGKGTGVEMIDRGISDLDFRPGARIDELLTKIPVDGRGLQFKCFVEVEDPTWDPADFRSAIEQAGWTDVSKGGEESRPDGSTRRPWWFLLPRNDWARTTPGYSNNFAVLRKKWWSPAGAVGAHYRKRDDTVT
jgi:hypothetical protein